MHPILSFLRARADQLRGRAAALLAPRAPSRPKDDGRAGVAPSVRFIADWDPKKIKLAMLTAEQGYLMYASSLCEWLLTDERVSGALSARTDALMGLPPTFEPGAGRKRNQAVKALEAGEDWWEAYPEGEVTQLLSWGILLGLAPANQAPWRVRADHAGRVLPSLSFWHPQTLKWDWQLRRWTIQDDKLRELELVPGDGEWLLHTPYGAQRPWAHGLWRSLARWVLLKQYAMSDWARHGEKAGMLVATAPATATKQQRKDLAEDLSRVGEDAAVALANGFDLKLVEVRANTRDIYEAQVRMANEAIAVRIRGGNLTTSISKGDGSRAATETQKETGDDAKLRFDASSISTTLHDQSLVWWAQFNYGDPRLAPWPTYPVEPEEDKNQRAQMVNTLGDGLTKMQKLGFEIDGEAVKEEFGLTFLGELKEPEPEPEPAPGGDPAPGEDDAAGKVNARALRAARARLASGARAEKSSGFVSGQLYVDDVVKDTQPAAGEEIEGTLLEELLEAIDGAKSWDAIRAAVTERWGAMKSPEELRALLQHAFYLADLAGTAGAREDA